MEKLFEKYLKEKLLENSRPVKKLPVLQNSTVTSHEVTSHCNGKQYSYKLNFVYMHNIHGYKSTAKKSNLNFSTKNLKLRFHIRKLRIAAKQMHYKITKKNSAKIM